MQRRAPIGDEWYWGAGYRRDIHWSTVQMGGVSFWSTPRVSHSARSGQVGPMCLLVPTTVGPTLRGAARRRTLLEGLRWPLSTSGRSGDTMVFCVWLTTCTRGLTDPLGRFCDTMREARGLLSGSCVVVTYNGLVGSLGTLQRYRAVGARSLRGLGSRRSGRFCDTFHLGCLSTSGRSGDTLVSVAGW